MSRSRRKTPMRGTCGCSSEKDDKRMANRRLRRRLDAPVLDPDTELAPLANEVSDPWLMGKDGKTRFDPKEWPEGLRK